MSKSRKKSRARDRRRPARGPLPAKLTAEQPKPSKSSWRSRVVFRESVEAVAIAFILAFLFRTFEAEAFVIPTGSMATTLMGQHRDVTCPKCGCPYQVGDSRADAQTGETKSGIVVKYGTCPNCRYTMRVGDEQFNGDRILVNKFVYHFEDPKPWDVAVFKYPEGAKTNFIKRIVGLPNETIRISHGDLFVQNREEPSLRIARKPPEKLRAMLQTVHDNDHVLPEALSEQGWPVRWQAEDASQGWVAAEDHRSFSNDGASGAEAWLRYWHFVPSQQTWDRVDHGMPLDPPRPQLISDFCAYNSGASAPGMPRSLGVHWVGDLAVSCTLEVRGQQGETILELVEGGRRMQCRIDVATGQALLSISGESFRRTGATPISRPGTYDVLFVNVDDQLWLWVDDKRVAFDGPTTYEPLGNTIPQPADCAPVGIATLGADVQISHIKVLRDIYYIADRSMNPGEPLCDYRAPYEHFRDFSQPSIREFLSDPNGWPAAFSDKSMPGETFSLGEDQFLVLGDNSAQSKDSRLWSKEKCYVDRELLIGKAVFIYWPHSWDAVWIGGARIPFPFFPHFKRMEFVR